jgi:4-hydroxy-2-oxoglutarate aldolase
LARDGFPDRRLLIAGTGCLSTAHTIKLSQRAAALGADAVLVLPPSYYRGRMTPETLTRHFHAVADACSIPVIIYNMPACTGLDLSADTICAIAGHPNVIGLKDSGGDVVKLGALHHTLGASFQILAGSAGFLLPALSIGAVGGVLALANLAPAHCLEIWMSALAGRWDRARELQVRLIEANAAVTQRWGVAGLKASLHMVGSEGGYVRGPLLDLAESDRESLRRILVDAQLLTPENTRSSSA